MKDIILKLKTEQLEQDELTSMIPKVIDHPEVLKLMLSQKNLSTEDRESVSDELFSSDLTLSVKPSDLKVLKALKLQMIEIDPEDIIVNFSEQDEKQLKSFAEMGLEEVTVKALRVKSNIFEGSIYLDLMGEKSAPILQKSKTRVLFEKAIMTTMFFAVVSGISSKAYADNTHSAQGSPQAMESVNNQHIQHLDQLKGDLNFLNKYLSLDKEAEVYSDMSKILHQTVSSSDDLHKQSVKDAVAHLSKSDKMDLELSVIKASEIAGRKYASHGFVKEKMQAFNDKITLVDHVHMTDAQNHEFDSLKHNKQVLELKDIAHSDESKLSSQAGVVKEFYTLVVETPANSDAVTGQGGGHTNGSLPNNLAKN